MTRFTLKSSLAGIALKRSGSSRKTRARTIVGLLLVAVLGGGITLWLVTAAADRPLRTISLAAPQAAASVIVDEQAGRALIVGGPSRASVSILDTTSGDLLHTVTLPGRFVSIAIAHAAGRAFVLSASSGGNGPSTVTRMSVVQIRTGALLRTVTVAPGVLAVDERGGHVLVVSGGAATLAGPPRGPGSVSLFDAWSGAIVHRMAVPGLRPWAAVVDRQTQRAFIANYALNTVSVLDARTGTLVQTIPVGQGPVAVAIDDHSRHVFVANQDGDSVRMLDARRGAVLQTIAVRSPMALAVDARVGRVVVANGGFGTVSLLDATSGALVATLHVGGSPGAVAVDARTSRAFVTNTQANRALFITLARVLHAGLSWAGENNLDGVSVLDTRSGALLRTLHIGPSAGNGVAVDTQVGHAFVVNPTDNSVAMLDATP